VKPGHQISAAHRLACDGVTVGDKAREVGAALRLRGSAFRPMPLLDEA
jgi:hypothetical protein